MWTDHARLAVARRYLASGASLKEAARAAGIPSDELDIMLWRGLGERPPKPAPRPMPQMRRDVRRQSRDDRFAGMVMAEARRVGLLTD